MALPIILVLLAAAAVYGLVEIRQRATIERLIPSVFVVDVPLHGVEIYERLRRWHDVRMFQGHIYPALRRLELRGVLVVVPGPNGHEQYRRYRLAERAS